MSVVSYFSADGNYEVTIMTKAILHHSGKVTWNPPAIYKSSCEIDVEFFPFDEQKCFMKFGSWTYDGYMVDLRHINQKGGNNHIEMGMDLQEYYISTEWDIMTVPAVRNEKYYPCCEEPYPGKTLDFDRTIKTMVAICCNVFRHHLLSYSETKIPVLYSQRHHSLRRHLVPVSPRFPPAVGLWRKGENF